MPPSLLASLPYRALLPVLFFSGRGPGLRGRRLGFHLRVLLAGGLALWLLSNALGAQTPAVPSPAVQAPGLQAPELQTPNLQAPELPTPAAAALRRASRFLSQRLAPDAAGGTPAEALLRARAQHLALLRNAQPHTANLTASWQPVGPPSIVSPTFGNLTGRVTALALDPNDPTGNTLYVGTTGGGVFKSLNAAGPLAAITFAPLTDTLPVFAPSAGSTVLPSLSIGALAVQPSANPVLLAGTGDPNDATDSYYGEGLLRSGDGGLTWTLVQGSHDGANGNHSFVGLATAGLAFSSANPAVAVAALSTAAEASTVAATNAASIPGLYVTTDAGLTWQMATLYDGAVIVQQPQPYGTGQAGNAATAVVWDPLRQLFLAAVRSHGYYSSADGQTWTRLASQPGTALTTANCPVGLNGTGSANCPIVRGALAVQPATGDLFALTVDAANNDQGLWQDRCNASNGRCPTATPTFANRLPSAPLEVGQGAANGSTAILQGGYDLALSAVPAAGGTTLLFAGMVDLYRCTLAADGTGCSLRNTTNAIDGCNAPAAVAPAQHALATLSTTTSALVYLGNDGGLWRSTDGVAETGPVCAASDATHFDNLNAAVGAGGSLAEFTGFAQHPADPNTLLAGLGANGSAGTSAALTASGALTPWPQLAAGEGGLPLLDPVTPGNWYLAIGAGVSVKACTLGAGCGAGDFVPPATVGAAQTAYDPSVLDAPTLLDPAATTGLLVGTCRVWRGPAGDGSTWGPANAISPAGFAANATACTPTSPLIRSLAAGGPAGSSGSAQLAGSAVIYAGMAGAADGGGTLGGHLFVTTTANVAYNATSWHDTALPNAAGFDVSSIAVDAHDATGATVYATVMGFGSAHVLRSTDFGGHWVNLSANLPDAPANAVAVDPNDANTVYVALDTGVYATQAASTCATANCWSVLGTALPNAPVIALAAGAALATGDGRHGLLRAATYGRGLWQTPLLTASTPAQPALTVAPTALMFADQQVSTQSATQLLTFTSAGNASVVFTTPAISGDFSIAANSCTTPLAPGATCTIAIAFTPTATGARSGLLTVYADIAGGQLTVALTGAGTAAAAVVLTPPALSFAATVVNQQSAAQIVTVANTGGNVATLQTPVVSGDFLITADTCTAALTPSTACSVQIVFAPTASGPRGGTLTVTGSAGTQTAQLSGSGSAPATDSLSPTALVFAQQTLGSASAAESVTLSNTGDVALTLVAAAVSAGDFAVTSACGTSLAAHSTCALSVVFTPAASGPRAATLTVSDQFRSQTVQLTGVGVAPAGVSLTPAVVAFGTVAVGQPATPQTLTLTNNGGLPLTIAGVTISPGFAIAATTCAQTLAANAACSYTLSFSPTGPGPVSGTLVLTDNAATPTQTVALSGTGLDFSLSANGPTTATLASGGTASYALLLSSVAGLSGTVTYACSGAPQHATCTVAPASGALGATSTLTATVTTGLSTARLLPPALPGQVPPRGPGRMPGLVFLALLGPLALAAAGRRRRRLLPLALLGGLLGCGAARIIPNATGGGGGGGTGSTTPTPSGSYNLVVSASSAGLTHSVGLTLIVQ